MALGQVCVGQSGTGTGLCWTEWHWDKFVLDRVALGQVCVGQSGNGTGLWWTEWHWDRFFFLPVLRLSVIVPPALRTQIRLHVAVTGRTNGRSMGVFKQAALFPKSG